MYGAITRRTCSSRRGISFITKLLEGYGHHLDCYVAWNVNFVPVAPDPHSGPRRGARTAPKETLVLLATSMRIRCAADEHGSRNRVRCKIATPPTTLFRLA